MLFVIFRGNFWLADPILQVRPFNCHVNIAHLANPLTSTEQLPILSFPEIYVYVFDILCRLKGKQLFEVNNRIWKMNKMKSIEQSFLNKTLPPLFMP